jgi:hypothetical protein
LESEPNDSAALKLRDEVTKTEEAWRTEQAAKFSRMRRMENVIPRLSSVENDAFGMPVNVGKFYPIITRSYKYDKKVVWRAVFAQGRVGLFNERPYMSNETDGWLVGKRYETKFSLFGRSSSCRHVVVVTDMGDNGVEVQVLTELYQSGSVTGDGGITLYSERISDVSQSTSLSNSFLDALGVKLSSMR